MADLRFAVFGAGFWARYQLAAWREVEGATCVGDLQPDAREGRAPGRRVRHPGRRTTTPRRCSTRSSPISST